MERYCFWWNLRSRASSCCVVKGVLGFRFDLCLRRWQVVEAIRNVVVDEDSSVREKKGEKRGSMKLSEWVLSMEECS